MSKKRHHSGNANMELEGQGGPSHLPERSMIKQYPSLHFGEWSEDFDTPEGVDRQINADARDAYANKKHARY